MSEGGASRRGFFRDLASAVGSAREVLAPEPSPAPEPPPPPPDFGGLSDAEIERYARQLVLPEWGAAAQLALSEANVLVVGAGALAAPVATYLVGAGVGRLGILDPDVVELSNLHRQTLHFTPDLGVPKAESAAAKLRFINPDVVIEPYQVRLEEENAGRADRGPGRRRGLLGLVRDALRGERGLLRGARTARRGRRPGPPGHGHEHQARADRLLPLRVPRRARPTRRAVPTRACSGRPRASSARSRRWRR